MALAVLFVGCRKSGEKEKVQSVAGQWHLTSWTGAEVTQDIYLSFKDDGTFDLYQRMYTMSYEHFDGTYEQDGHDLNGKYSDGKQWNGNPYEVTFSEDGNTMTMTQLSNPEDVSVYVRASIPEEVLDGGFVVKSADERDNGAERYL